MAKAEFPNQNLKICRILLTSGSNDDKEGAGPQGVEPRSMVPETIVLSIELQTLSESVDTILGPIEVNT